MYNLFIKEISGFFSSFTAYMVIIVFLLSNALLLWVFPGYYNILDNGYASLEPLFVISPYVFLFLVSAVTMRMFSEEKKQQTLDLLFTRPITEMQVVLAKYFASVILVILSLVPTFVFYISVYLLGNPQGNLDSGASWGSYLGLFFLASIYASIGLFASSITENQIFAFIISCVISLSLFIGFDSLVALFSNQFSWMANLGINEHYKSISRGIVDSRDLIYFLTVVIVFVLATRLKLQSRKW